MLFRRKPKRLSPDGYVEVPSSRIPHAKSFERTPEGFTVVFQTFGTTQFRRDERPEEYLDNFGRKDRATKYVDNCIEATRDAVIINGQRYHRSHFKGFCLTSLPYSDGSESPRISFTYGMEILHVGIWKDNEKAEFEHMIAILNDLLREIPQNGSHGQQVDAEQLRNNRPSDF